MKRTAKRKTKRKCWPQGKFLILFLVLQGLPLFSALALIDTSIIAVHSGIGDKRTYSDEDIKEEASPSREKKEQRAHP